MSWSSLPPAVWVLVVARAVNRLGAFTLPFLAVVLTVELGATVSQAGLILTGFGLATIPSRLFGGHLADRIGRKWTIVAGLGGCAVAQLWIAASPGLWSAIPAVVLLGLAFEIYEPPSQAIIADVTGPADRPAAYGLLGAAMAVAAVAAGLLAAWLGQWDLRWLFVVDAATCLACAVLVGLALPGARRAQLNRAARAWRDRKLLLMLGVGTVFAVLYMEVLFGLPLTMLDEGVPASGVGIVLAVSALTQIAGQPLLRRLVLDDFQVMTVGYVLLAVGLLATGFAGSLSAFVVAAVVWSLGDLLLLGRALTIVSGLAPEHARGRYLATYGLSWGFATAVAPLAGSWLIEGVGSFGLWAICGLAAGGLAAVQPLLRCRLRKPD
ncbi:MFS transporter [Kribbella sancticallisti]